MEECINKSTLPIFGYPLVCFSPTINNKNNTNNDKYWEIMYKTTMQSRAPGT